jgi:hypothetical protein
MRWILKDIVNNSKQTEQETTTWGLKPLQFIKILRAMNYSLGESVADLIDNSIDIGADEINVYFDFDMKTFNCFLIVADNGYGMSENQLQNNMDIGASNKHSKNHLGKFGVGLKLSSMVQADDITVLSKTSNSNPIVRRISYDFIKESNELKLLTKIDKESHYEYIEELMSNYDSGTVILWEKMNKIVSKLHTASGRSSFDKLKIKLADHLSMTFHRYITGKNRFNKKITIRLNDAILQPLDPLLEDYKDLDSEYHGTIIEVEHITFKNEPIKIQMAIIPHDDWIQDKPEWKRLDGLFDGITKAQGTYVYRNDRLISAGGWEQSTGWTNHSSRKLARLSIDLNPSFDEVFGLEPTKTGYDFPVVFQDMIIHKVNNHTSHKWDYNNITSSFSDKARHRNRNESKKGAYEVDKPSTKKEENSDNKQPSNTDTQSRIPSQQNPNNKTTKNKPTIPEGKIEPNKKVIISEENMPVFTELIWVSKKGNLTEVIINTGHNLHQKLIESLDEWYKTKD